MLKNLRYEDHNNLTPITLAFIDSKGLAFNFTFNI